MTIPNLRQLIKDNFLFIIVLLLSVFLRAYRFDTLTTFGGDQGQDFLVVRDMALYHKWTLLGIKTSLAPFFQGPIYLYMLLPFFMIFSLNPISGAIASIFISVIIIVLLYFLVIRNFSKESALWSCLLYATSPELVRFGNTPLYQHFLPPFILMGLIFFLARKRSFLAIFLVGLSGGIGVEMHLLNVTLVIAIFIYYLVKNEQRLQTLLSYMLGLILGISPTLFFELRHQFLNTKLLMSYLSTNDAPVLILKNLSAWLTGSARFLGGDFLILGVLILGFAIYSTFRVAGSKEYRRLRTLGMLTFVICMVFAIKLSGFTEHYALPVWMFLLIFIPYWATQIFSKKTARLILSLLIIANLYGATKAFNNNHGHNMPSGWTLSKIDKIGKIISTDSKKHPNFNVASIIDGNTRTYPVRYATLYYGATPNDVDHYPNDSFLYLVGRRDTNKIMNSNVWEVASMRPFVIGKKWDMKDNALLYRLERVAK